MTSKTVERLQISGTLVEMGGEIPSLMIECDFGEIVAVTNLPVALLAAMPMLLYKRVTLTVQAEAEPVPAAAPDDAEPRFGPITSDPADAERNMRAKEDAERSAYLWSIYSCPQPSRVSPLRPQPAEDPERAAYLRRWEDAPGWAQWLTEAADASAAWSELSPIPFGEGFFYVESGRTQSAPFGVLGSTRCEPRPPPVEDPERAAYLKRWAGAPAEATHLAEDSDGECFWHSSEPRGTGVGVWHDGLLSRAGENLLGFTRCEPRPEAQS